MPKKGTRKCQECGLFKEDVTDGYSPYQSEINGIEVKVTWCEDCFYNDAMEI